VGTEAFLESANFLCPEQPPSVLPVKLDRSEARRSLTGKDTIEAAGSETK